MEHPDTLSPAAETSGAIPPANALAVARQAALEAAGLQLSLLDGGMRVSSKSSSVDMVTNADKGSERIIRDHIGRAFPDHTILGEEGGNIPGKSASGSPWRWIIDPLDGTTNYVHHHPVFCISIALTWKGRPVLGLVHVPRLNETYEAESGKGARKNGKPIRVSANSSLRQSLMATGVPYDRAESRDNNVEYIAAMIPQVRGLRRMGAAAYDLCLVAEGVYDAYWELKIRPWDIAAGFIILREAGGLAWAWPHRTRQDPESSTKVLPKPDDSGEPEQPEEPPLLDCLTCSPSIRKELTEALNSIGGEYRVVGESCL